MTSFVAWVGVDSRGPSSINFASDSRISWDKSGQISWDSARKTFSCKNYPDIFGYVNDVTFPSIVIGQIVTAIDSGCLYKNETCSKDRINIVKSHIKHAFENYSRSNRNSFSIFHASRENEKMHSIFHLHVISWISETNTWDDQEIEIPLASSVLRLDGSGTQNIAKWTERWNSSSQGHTSRSVFSAFCDSVYSGEDKLTSGPPQIVSVYRKWPGRTIGFVNNGRKYFAGTEILDDSQGALENIEWRNRNFERCQSTGELVNMAQKHHVPKGLGR